MSAVKSLSLLTVGLAGGFALALVARAPASRGREAPERAPEKAEPAPVASAVPADWCAGHGVPESKCTRCNPALVAAFKAADDWCEEHGLPESVCPGCRPSPVPAASPSREWCAEHAVPEAKCTRCCPALAASFKKAGDWCPEHDFPESVCPTCHPSAPPPGYVARPRFEASRRVRFRSPETERAAGLEVAPATEGPSAPTVECTARIAFDASRLAELNAPLPGIVKDVLVGLGEPVVKDQPLLVIESAHLGELRARLRGALARAAGARSDHERKRGLAAESFASARELELAREELASTEAEARALEGTIAVVGSSSDEGGRYLLRSPLAGQVVRLPALRGRLAGESDPLVTVADTATFWALLDVREWDAPLVRLGQPVEVRVEGLDDRAFTGRVSWVSAEADAKTRTVEVRAALANVEGLLKANLFARATVQVGAAGTAVLVPREALQRLDAGWVVFVRAGQGVYEPRSVALGRVRGSVAELVSGVRSGEPVVTTGAFLLKTELVKDSLGAGCCDDDRGGKR